MFTCGRQIFTVNVNAQPCFQDFKDQMVSARGRNVRLVHVAGHGLSKCGFFWLKDGSKEYEMIPIDTFVKILGTEVSVAKGGTIECVVLNACETEDMGKQLRRVTRVSYVVCWRSKVQDNTAREFVLQFYKSLQEQEAGRDYKLAFQHAVGRMVSEGGVARARVKHLALGAVDYVCLLSEDGDEFPDTGFISPETKKGANSNAGPMKLESESSTLSPDHVSLENASDEDEAIGEKCCP